MRGAGPHPRPGPAIIAGRSRSAGFGVVRAVCVLGGRCGGLIPAVMSSIPDGARQGKRPGPSVSQSPRVAINGSLGLSARRGCNGSATCEVWEVPAMFEHTFIGLDVHAVNVVGHALNPATGEISNHTMAADPAVVLEWVRRFEPPLRVRPDRIRPGPLLAGCRH